MFRVRKTKIRMSILEFGGFNRVVIPLRAYQTGQLLTRGSENHIVLLALRHHEKNPRRTIQPHLLFPLSMLVILALDANGNLKANRLLDDKWHAST